jgi:hypothetical protein
MQLKSALFVIGFLLSTATATYAQSTPDNYQKPWRVSVGRLWTTGSLGGQAGEVMK